MIELDRSLMKILDGVLPPGNQEDDWSGVLAEASRSRPVSWLQHVFPFRRRIVWAALVAVLALLIPYSALAISQDDWWFLDSGKHDLAGNVIVLRSGAWNGTQWTLAGYRTRSGGLCVAFTPNGPDLLPSTPLSGHSAAELCNAPIIGAPGLTSAEQVQQLAYIGSFTVGEAPSGFPDFIAGPTAPGIARVEIAMPGQAPVSADTFSAPSELDVSTRFFVMRIPPNTKQFVLSALSTTGVALERLVVSPGQAGSPPMPTTDSQGNPLKVITGTDVGG